MLASGDSLILSGASRGIGRALALALASRGVHLALNARDPGPLAEAAEGCRQAGAAVEAVAGDCSRDEVARELAARAGELGRFQGFIHVAGVLRPGPYIWELEAEQAAEVMAASHGGALALIRAAVPALRRQGRGLAVFFGSGASQRHQVGIGLYSAAKAAEEFIAGQLAAEAPEITSLVYRPAVADTRMQTQARQAVGGGASVLRPVFNNYLESRQLLSPEQAAGALMTALEGDWRELSGRVVDARQVLSGRGYS
ncbi:MAG: SDR family NAD(P)-dependent oxidoreductase [Desulfarculaceae bacterium]|nr:SDR family NAD(P)-dependent oxidoreductase [Desulfarculaceae bacterium]MCF8072483.1 SDR family NAD(P)-dependent oxidoreductase [Desulfarculaceae bacterium]MCF8102944.1 SDR family NAD(P)-dependent oxidoreductase [Desulfarculaceae bacterium]MCF8117453.1 SDR family NAD(P)-dependent oxidoreductase [Desulfarculaceae bacterium]